MLLVLIILEKEAPDPDQLSLVSKLNGCRLQWCKIGVEPLASSRNDKSINSFDSFGSAIFLFEYLTVIE